MNHLASYNNTKIYKVNIALKIKNITIIIIVFTVLTNAYFIYFISMRYFTSNIKIKHSVCHIMYMSSKCNVCEETQSQIIAFFKQKI